MNWETILPPERRLGNFLLLIVTPNDGQGPGIQLSQMRFTEPSSEPHGVTPARQKTGNGNSVGKPTAL